MNADYPEHLLRKTAPSPEQLSYAETSQKAGLISRNESLNVSMTR